MVSTYKELLDKWGRDLDRSDLSFEDELTYVDDWYELSKSLPTKPFEPNFTDYAKYKGQSFEIVDTVSYVNDDVDLENKIEMTDLTEYFNIRCVLEEQDYKTGYNGWLQVYQKMVSRYQTLTQIIPDHTGMLLDYDDQEKNRMSKMLK